MSVSRRRFLGGAVASVATAGTALADEFVAAKGKLPPGGCGDPANLGFAKNIFPLEHTLTDGPSCFLKDGRVFEPAREVPQFHTTDVVVVGGGPAGFSAAIAAARAGAKVALVERYGSLGGLFTNGMVLILLSTSRKDASGRFSLVTRGVCEEFMNRAVALGPRVASKSPRARDGGHWQPTVDPEGAKYLMDRMIAEAGVEMFFHSWGVDVIQNGDRVQGVVFESKEGRQAILAREVVDCTGDADMLFKAGGDYRQITHAIGFVTRLGNVDRITAKTAPKGPDGKPLPGKWITRGNESNKATAWCNTLGPKGNGLSVRDLSAAEVAHRRYWWEHVAKMQKTPGWEEVFIANTCSQIGPRATRLVDTELVTGRAEIRAGLSFGDVVGWLGQDGPHAAFPVSYRNLLPKKVDHLLCAGRCLGTGDTIDTFRLICPCMVTGQAAGAAAALAARGGVAPRNLPYATLRAELLRQNVLLDS